MVAATQQTNIQQKTIEQEIAEIVVHELPWTEEMYFRVSEVNHFMELSDGKLVIHDMPIPRHQSIVGEIHLELSLWNKEKKMGKVFVSPMPVRLWEGKIREPDIMYYSNENRERIKEKYGKAPDLAVEILSDDSVQRDRVEKMEEYAKAGIKEYWIVDPEKKNIEVYSLSKKKYQQSGTFGCDQILSSTLLPDLEIPLASIFDE